MKVLVAADAEWVRNQVRSAFVAPGQEVIEVTHGQAVKAAVAEHEPDLVILDMQIANMGGVAVAIELRLEEAAGRLDPSTILLLLDREVDAFVARRADADATLVKPVDAGTLRRTAKRLLAEAAEAAEAAADLAADQA
jgi:DNA-binding response OmpR family regulator